MSIEKNLERIATALEAIANVYVVESSKKAAPAPKAPEAPAPAPAAPTGNVVHSAAQGGPAIDTGAPVNPIQPLPPAPPAQPEPPAADTATLDAVRTELRNMMHDPAVGKKAATVLPQELQKMGVSNISALDPSMLGTLVANIKAALAA